MHERPGYVNVTGKIVQHGKRTRADDPVGGFSMELITISSVVNDFKTILFYLRCTRLSGTSIPNKMR
jgi:hypothetical protein